MRKKELKCMLLLISALLIGGCGTEGVQENNSGTDEVVTFQNPDAQTESSSAVQDAAGSNAAGEDLLSANGGVLDEKLAALETLDWTELDCYVDEEISMLNSNLLNFGNLTYDDNGQIYFVDKNNGGIYASDWNGENKRQISEDNAIELQIVGEWLYYNCFEGAVKRLHCKTGEVELIRDGACGEYIVVGDKIYYNAPEGFCVTELDGSNKEILRNTDLTMMHYRTDGAGFWFGNLYSDTDAEYFSKGYLLGFDEEQKKLYFIKENSMFPLLAGNWLSVMSGNTRHVWNLASGEDIDSGKHDPFVVSDGNILYYSISSAGVFYQWDGEETKELFRIEEEGDYMLIENKYLTPKALYWLQSVSIDSKQVWGLGYYDLETGEIGKIY